MLTDTHVWLFECEDLGRPFFEGRVRRRAYAYTDGKSDSESICFEDDANLLIADEARGKLYRFPLAGRQGWRRGRHGMTPHSMGRPGSNPGPLACKANALANRYPPV